MDAQVGSDVWTEGWGEGKGNKLTIYILSGVLTGCATVGTDQFPAGILYYAGSFKHFLKTKQST